MKWIYGGVMIIENRNNEIIIRIPANIDINISQDFIEYVHVKSILSGSSASQEDIEKISDEINKLWWEKNKTRFIK